MNLNITLENSQQQCRICLGSGDINISNYKFSFERQCEEYENDFIEKSFTEIIDIFVNSQDLLNYTEEFSFLCWQCLEDVKFCYIMYEKIKLANNRLEKQYLESLNQCIEEEHLIEVIDENELSGIQDTNLIETVEEKKISELVKTNEVLALNKSILSEQIQLDKNDSFIVTQFVPETVVVNRNKPNQNDNNNVVLFEPSQQLLTVNLKAVEVKDLHNLDCLESSHFLSVDSAESAVYICQYCPQAFSKSEYLKTHVQKSHVCKFCTQAFNATEDLFKHIREVHTENKCAICHKMLSSRTNLRHHMKRIHQIKLPAKVTLIDFIKSKPIDTSKQENEVVILKEKLETVGMPLNTQYMWANDDCIEMFSEGSSDILG